MYVTCRDSPNFQALLLHRQTIGSFLPDITNESLLLSAVSGGQSRLVAALVFQVGAVEIRIRLSRSPSDFVWVKSPHFATPVELSRAAGISAVNPKIVKNGRIALKNILVLIYIYHFMF